MSLVQLGSVVDVVMGQAPASSDCNFNGQGTPFVKVGEFGETRPIIREWTTNPLKIAWRTDVLLCVVGATCGKINLGEDCAIGRSVAAIRPKPAAIDQFYLHYFLMTYVLRLRAGSVGAAQTVISKEMIRSIPIPLPPLAEQRRIVAILDEAFAGLAKMRANAEANLKNARALFDSHLNAVFSQGGEGWKETTLEAIVAETLIGLVRSVSEQGDKRGYPYVKMNHITSDNNFQPTNITNVDANQYEVEKFSLRKGDILFNTRNSRELVGKFCIYMDQIPGNVVYNNNIMRIRVRSDIDPLFLIHAFQSIDVRRSLESMKSGTTNVAAIYYKDLRKLRLSLPSFETQKLLSSGMEELYEAVQALAESYRQKNAAIDALKQSIFAKAFAGELTSTDALAA